MKCEQVMELMDDFLDSELPPDSCDHLQEHLAHCRSCSSTLHSFQSLKSQAASLPQTITPQRDLWPEIANRLIVADLPRQFHKFKSDQRKPNWRRAVRFWPWVAAAALCCTLCLFFSMRPGSRQRGGEAAKLSNGPETGKIVPDQNKKEIPAALPLPNGTWQERVKPGMGLKPESLEYDPGYRSYFYAVTTKLDPSNHLESSRVLRFEPDGTVSSWEPALPSDMGPVYSVYPGPGGRLWLSCQTVDTRSAVFFEGNFGDDDPPKELGRLNGSFISQIAVGPQGSIYALGVRNDLLSSVRALARGQSITADIIHVLDPKSGRQNNLMPVTFEPNYAIDNWQRQLDFEMLNMPNQIRISFRSNGNFILSIPPERSNFSGLRALAGKEAMEYSPDGQAVRKLDPGILETGACIGNIFVDIDDSLLLEVAYSDASKKPNMRSGTLAHRYFLRMNHTGALSRIGELVPTDETIVGWIGETREMVTRVNAAKQGMMEIRFRKLPI